MTRLKEGAMSRISHTVRAMLDAWDYEIGGVLPDGDSDQGSEEDSSGSEYESCDSENSSGSEYESCSEEQETEMKAEMAEHRALRERGSPLRRE